MIDLAELIGMKRYQGWNGLSVARWLAYGRYARMVGRDYPKFRRREACKEWRSLFPVVKMNHPE